MVRDERSGSNPAANGARGWVTALLLCLALAAEADTALRGLVTDRTTGLPLAGAKAELRRGITVVQAGVSGNDGSYLLTVDVGNSPQAQNLKLAVTLDGFVDLDHNVIITSGRPDSPVYRAVLVRTAVAECKVRRARRVVVGHFRPPIGLAGGSNFSARVTDALLYELSFLERSRVAAERRPAVVTCDRLDDRENLTALARELQADALMSGTVGRSTNPGVGGTRFNVAMFLGDPYGLFPGATPVTSRDVDLEDPSASRLSPAAMAAVYQALLTGYLRSEQFADCVELGGLALAALPRPPPAAPLSQALLTSLSELRAQCQRRLPVNALLGP